jgi:hypothetical protein
LNSIHGALGPLSSFFGLCATLYAIEEEWPEVAGDALARRSAPRSYDDGVLVVAVENRLVQQDMNFRKNSILRAIALKTSLNLKDIRAEIAPLARGRSPERHPPSSSARRRPEVAGPEVDAMKAGIMERHPNISERLAEAIAICRSCRQPSRR